MKTTMLLREDVPHLGRVGDVVRVLPGYARNYLLPQRLAVEATPENMALMKRRRSRMEAEEAARTAQLEARAELLSRLVLTTRERADEAGQLFGSVSASTIARLLKEAGHAFEEADVRLPEPIKAIGTFKVRIHVHGETHAEVGLVVEAAPF